MECSWGALRRVHFAAQRRCADRERTVQWSGCSSVAQLSPGDAFNAGVVSSLSDNRLPHPNRVPIPACNVSGCRCGMSRLSRLAKLTVLTFIVLQKHTLALQQESQSKRPSVG